MLRYLILRPIAVLMGFGALVLFGLYALGLLPVSLLPALETPRVLLRAHYPNTAARRMEQQVSTPLREALLSLGNLEGMETRTANHVSTCVLQFRHGTRMDLALQEINERLDRLTTLFPRDMARPQVIPVQASDIPLIRLQVVPRSAAAYGQVSELVEKTIKRRLEQVPGVAMADLHGARHPSLQIRPYPEALQALGLHEGHISRAIQGAHSEMGSHILREGPHQYFLRIGSAIQDPEALSRLPIPTSAGSSVALGRLAEVRTAEVEPGGYHLFNGQESLVLTIYPQAKAQANDVVKAVRAEAASFAREYPQARFRFTQDQTFLLDAGIGNLAQSLVLGGLLAAGVLFLFQGHYAAPLLMGLSIPVSLLLTFVCFYALGISLNILSLSGLALGLGMLIDNAIVVLDHISRLRRSGAGATESCANGVREVAAPVLSQVLTTVAVYAPLVLISGLAGALIGDQALALTLSLCVSLAIAFLFSPTLYHLLVPESAEGRPDTRLYLWLSRLHQRWIAWAFAHQAAMFGLCALVAASSIPMALRLPLSTLPDLEKRETLLHIDWNEPIDAAENLARVRMLDRLLAGSGVRLREADAGIPQFLLAQEALGSTQARVYYQCADQAKKERVDQQTAAWLRASYPQASVEARDAPNAFTQLFAGDTPYLEARFRAPNNIYDPAYRDDMEALLRKIPPGGGQKGEGLQQEPVLELVPDPEALSRYGVAWPVLHERIDALFGAAPIAELKPWGTALPLYFARDSSRMEAPLEAGVEGKNGVYPLKKILQAIPAHTYKYITADKNGPYQSLRFEGAAESADAWAAQLGTWAGTHGFSVTFQGQHYDRAAHGKQLLWVFLMSLALLYFILAMQFEDLVQPLIVLSTLPMGIFGSVLFLHLGGASLDILAGIGFVVVLGIITDDPILKVHTMNRLRQMYCVEGLSPQDSLERAVREAGEICLKPVLMTSLTTILALLPTLYLNGIGTELQRTMTLVIAGGLSVGTFFTLIFVPLVYRFIEKNKMRA
jgi:multidrug efflux pump subunit AcrB